MHAETKALGPLRRVFLGAIVLLIACSPPIIGAQEPPAGGREKGEPAALEGQLIDVGGFRLHAQALGEASTGPAVVFDAGFGQELASWRGLPAVIAEHTRVVVYERAGVGRSERGPEPRTAHRVAGELHALLAALAVEPPYLLVGHSFGGLYIRVFADLYPDEVAGFVFLDPTVEGMLASLWTEEGWAQHVSILEQMSEGLQAEGLQMKVALDELKAVGPPPDVPAALVTALSAAEISEATREQMEAFGVSEEKFRELQAIKHRAHAEVAAKFPHGRLVEVPGASHFVHWDEPGLVERTILEVYHQASRCEPRDCVYAAVATAADPDPGLSPFPGCGCILPGGSFSIGPEHLRRLAFDGDDPATIYVDGGQVAYVRRDGKTAWILPFDNGADYFVEGLARTVRGSKVGFIDTNLDVVVEPVWDFAFPFEDGLAVVCQECGIEPACPGCEHSEVTGGRWGYIDRKGEVVVPVEHRREDLPARSEILETGPG